MWMNDGRSSGLNDFYVYICSWKCIFAAIVSYFISGGQVAQCTHADSSTINGLWTWTDRQMNNGRRGAVDRTSPVHLHLWVWSIWSGNGSFLDEVAWHIHSWWSSIYTLFGMHAENVSILNHTMGEVSADEWILCTLPFAEGRWRRSIQAPLTVGIGIDSNFINTAKTPKGVLE